MFLETFCSSFSFLVSFSFGFKGEGCLVCFCYGISFFFPFDLSSFLVSWFDEVFLHVFLGSYFSFSFFCSLSRFFMTESGTGPLDQVALDEDEATYLEVEGVDDLG